MHPLIRDALAETADLHDRGFKRPSEATLAEAERLLALVHPRWPAPQVEAQSDGALTLDWDAGTRGWLQLTVRGDGRLWHSAVIDGDDLEQDEAFADVLPAWADTLLDRLLPRPH